MTTEIGTLDWSLYENPGVFERKAQFVLPVYHGPKGFSYGNDLYPEAVADRRRGLGVSSAEAAKRIVLSGNFVGFLPDIIAADAVERGDLRAVTGDGARRVSRPLFLSVRADQVSKGFQKHLISAIGSELKL